MSRLRDTIHDVARGGVLPVLSLERLFAIEHVAARLDRQANPAYPPASIADLVETAGGVDALSTAELRRAVGAVWSVRVPAAMPARLLEALLARTRRSGDRAIIEAYLRHYPVAHAGFAALRRAAETAAERHDWRWRTAGREYHLWEADAVARCTAILREAERPDAVRGQMGLLGKRAEGAFASLLTG